MNLFRALARNGRNPKQKRAKTKKTHQRIRSRRSRCDTRARAHPSNRYQSVPQTGAGTIEASSSGQPRTAYCGCRLDRRLTASWRRLTGGFCDGAGFVLFFFFVSDFYAADRGGGAGTLRVAGTIFGCRTSRQRCSARARALVCAKNGYTRCWRRNQAPRPVGRKRVGCRGCRDTVPVPPEPQEEPEPPGSTGTRRCMVGVHHGRCFVDAKRGAQPSRRWRRPIISYRFGGWRCFASHFLPIPAARYPTITLASRVDMPLRATRRNHHS